MNIFVLHPWFYRDCSHRLKSEKFKNSRNMGKHYGGSYDPLLYSLREALRKKPANYDNRVGARIISQKIKL